jgi:hypothetical protein
MKLFARPLYFWAIVACLTASCRPAAEVQPNDVRTYTAPRSIRPAETAAKPPRNAAANASSAAASSGPTLEYDLPEGWTDMGASGMRLASLRTGPGDPAKDPAVGEITIIPASGTLQSNAARWQEQLTPGADPDLVASAIEKAETVPVNGVEGTILLLQDNATDNQQAILAAMIPLEPSTSLFVKYKGSAAQASTLREPFTAFVRSIRWK